MKIGEHEVKATSRDTARVGCQHVTRQQALEVIKQMDQWAETITSSDGMMTIVPVPPQNLDYVTMVINFTNTGFIGASEEEVEYVAHRWNKKSLGLCLTVDQAVTLANFLNDRIAKARRR